MNKTVRVEILPSFLLFKSVVIQLKCKNGIIVESKENVLIISGKGILGTIVKDIIDGTICKSSKYKVECIIDNGITTIENFVFFSCDGLSGIKMRNRTVDENIWYIEILYELYCRHLYFLV